MNKNNKIISPREVSLLIWENVFYKNIKFNYEFDNNLFLKSLNQKDRSFVYFLISLCLRRNKQIKKIFSQYIIKNIGRDKKVLTSILTLGTAEIIWLRTPNHAILYNYVELTKKLAGKHFSGFINAVLRKITNDKEIKQKIFNNSTENLPEYLRSQWINFYGEKSVNEFSDLIMREPYLDLICSKKITLDEKKKLISSIRGKEIYPNVIRSFYKGKISSIQGYENGYWWIQDIGSYIQFEILLKKIFKTFQNCSLKNLNLLDLCSAPGGKTIQILDNEMNVFSVEKNLSRIHIMNRNLSRLKLKSKIICQDASTIRTKKYFDVILIDAPCSSTGTIRKNPDILLRSHPSNLKKIIETQMKILSNAKNLLKTNGLLMYVVCSLEKNEGEKVILEFCRKNKNFKIDHICDSEINIKNSSIITSDGFLRILPNSLVFSKNNKFNGSDGFFSAILKKTTNR